MGACTVPGMCACITFTRVVMTVIEWKLIEVDLKKHT